MIYIFLSSIIAAPSKIKMSTSETSPALYFQLSLSFISIMLNIIGVYCLHHRKRGNKNQQLLLQNLAIVEILKVPWVLFWKFNFAIIPAKKIWNHSMPMTRYVLLVLENNHSDKNVNIWTFPVVSGLNEYVYRVLR